ncbi:hypothetical protein ASE66_23080 [Bosea sp. Root483D1]|nr:hypothetical protein ASE66_23080 [Bosea sp. Root483D1]
MPLVRSFYTGLAAQPRRNGKTLIALSAAGGSKAADALSEGTRFQRYRRVVPGLVRAARSTVPLVADEIMETFDDFRAEEAFRLFTDMAQTGQVIHLTHHPASLRDCPAGLSDGPSAQPRRWVTAEREAA